MENKFIIVVVVALFIIALMQLMKVYDLAAKIRGEKSEEKVTRGENIFNANMLIVFMLAYFGFIIWLIFKYGMNGGLFDAASVHDKRLIHCYCLTGGLFFLYSF